MFEKEAEEWVENNLHSTEEDYIKAFKDGAEFGYNKANEWHYVKDGDLPKDNNEKLCFHGKGTVVARYDDEYGCWETYFNNLETVIPSIVIIAWLRSNKSCTKYRLILHWLRACLSRPQARVYWL